MSMGGFYQPDGSVTLYTICRIVSLAQKYRIQKFCRYHTWMVPPSLSCTRLLWMLACSAWPRPTAATPSLAPRATSPCQPSSTQSSVSERREGGFINDVHNLCCCISDPSFLCPQRLCTLWGHVLFYFFQKFRLPIWLHNSCSICPMANG